MFLQASFRLKQTKIICYFTPQPNEQLIFKEIFLILTSVAL